MARLRRERNERTTQAWLTAQLTGVAMNNPKKFPKLDNLLDKGLKHRRRQTPDEMLAAAKAWMASAPRG